MITVAIIFLIFAAKLRMSDILLLAYFVKITTNHNYMENKKLYLIIVAILALSAIAAGICHDMIDADIQSKEFNLGLAESANESSMSISGFQYDYGQKGYGSFQTDQNNYEKKLHSYERRHDRLDTQKTMRDVFPIIIILIGCGISYYVYKKNSLKSSKANRNS